MAPLDEALNSDRPGGTPQPLEDDYDSDDDDGSGEHALLNENTQTRRETPSKSAAFWKQTSGMIVEVSASSVWSSVPDPRSLDTTNTFFHHNKQSFYGGAVLQDIRTFIYSWSTCTSYIMAALESDDQR